MILSAGNSGGEQLQGKHKLTPQVKAYIVVDDAPAAAVFIGNVVYTHLQGLRKGDSQRNDNELCATTKD